MNKINKKHLSLILLTALVFPWLAPLFPTRAANLNQGYLRLDRMIASTATGGTVCLMMNNNSLTEAHVEVTFPTGFTVNGTATNWTVSTTNLPAGSTAMPGINTAENVASQTVRFPISNITSSATLYCFNFTGTSTLTTSGAGTDLVGSIAVTESDNSEIDSISYATAVITDDQVVITATVPPTFSFALGTNVQALGTLSSSSVISGSGVSVTLGTNAAHGWLTWVKSQYAYLYSPGHNIPTAGTINASPSQLIAGTEGYVLDCDETTDSGTVGSGDVTIAAEYLGDDLDDDEGGTLSTTFQEVATANGPTDGDIVTLVPRVAISAMTPAANYTDTLTVVGAANF